VQPLKKYSTYKIKKKRVINYTIDIDLVVVISFQEDIFKEWDNRV
jgi:hypothetical protein